MTLETPDFATETYGFYHFKTQTVRETWNIPLYLPETSLATIQDCALGTLQALKTAVHLEKW